jgi:serine/threonine protein phosphatase PrpC
VNRYSVNACTAQHIGDRAEQQDRLALTGSPNVGGALMAVVADGMGGKTGGAMAAEQVVSTAKAFFKDWRNEDPLQRGLDNMVSEAHTIIQLSGLTEEKEPHSTVVVLVITPQVAHWMHVGDSRLYHFRNGELYNRTLDHSYVQDMISQGKMTPEQAATHKYRNMITSALGTQQPPRVTHEVITDHGIGDAFLLCTDGVWAYFSDAELERLICTLPPRDAAELMVQLCRERSKGRGDNLSMVIVRLDGPPELKG